MYRKSMFTALCFCSVFCLSTYADDASGNPFTFQLHPINPDSKFEAAGIGDINGDGKKDIVCGAYWYEAPDWTAHKLAELEELSGYYNDFANELQDVDADGDLDIVDCTWFSQEVFWRENPGAGKDGLWPVHSIDKPGNMETGILYDVNKDGTDDFVPNVMSEVVWFEKTPGKAEWTKHSLPKEGAGHGLGPGDINGDGMTDIVTLKGWYEAKPSGDQMDYEWHPEFTLGDTCIPIEVADVDGDGLSDIIWGMGHDYGVFWLQQGKDGDQRTWTRHEIDKTWSQAHYIEMADLDGDGQDELVTGKRYYAHNGGDPGAEDPRNIYIYDFDREKGSWTRYPISEGGKPGFGLNADLQDIDGDGDLDLLCPGKSGLYLFERK